MNIYLSGIKAQLRSSIVWAASILIFFYACVAGIFPAFMGAKPAVESAILGFPAEFAAAFGVVITRIFTFGGFFQFMYLYVGIFGAIMAVSFSAGIFSREKRSKCVDFLFTKPVSRACVFAAKLMACLTLIIVFNALFLLLCLILYRGAGEDTAKLGNFIWGGCALFFLQLVFTAIGIVFAVFAPKIRSVSGTATAFGIGAFIITALKNLLEDDKLKFIAPLNYFEPISVFTTGGFELKYALTGAAVFIGCLAVAFIKYCRSDTRSV